MIDQKKSSVSTLVVDDEPIMRDLLRKILTRDGYRVLEAEGGEAALETMAKENVDIVISDLEMPGMDGFDLLKAIKSRYPRVGVVMMTAYGDMYTLKDALLFGADEYITKPFKDFEISIVIERACWRLASGAGRTSARSE